MPKREDVFGADEYEQPELQLHRHVMYHTQPGDMVVVDARGDLKSGIFGDMMLTYFKGKGGVGCIVDGCIRDFKNVKKIDVGLWTTGLTPNFHAQTDIMPFAVNVPISCGGTLVFPGDIVVADDDGAIVVPVKLAEAGHRARRGSITTGRNSPSSASSRAATSGATTRSPRRRGRNTRNGATGKRWICRERRGILRAAALQNFSRGR